MPVLLDTFMDVYGCNDMLTLDFNSLMTEPAVKDSIIRDGQMAFYSLDIARISTKTLHDPG